MFEHSLLASQRRSTRVLIVPLSLGVHAVALAGVAIAQYWTIDAVAEPSIQVSFADDLVAPRR